MKTREIVRQVFFASLLVALLVACFLFGYLRGHRSAALVLLHQEARDHFSMGVMLFRQAPTLAPPRKQDADSALRHLYDAREYAYGAKHLTQNRFARVQERQSSYEHTGERTKAQELDDLWQRIHREITFVEANRSTDRDRVPLAGQPSHTTGLTDRLSDGTAVSKQTPPPP